MPAKWQQWMPFKIDAFKGSPAVRAMHPAARSGYLYLLTFQWQTDDCTIPSDPLALAEISEIGDELWALHGPRILRNFVSLDDGKLRNEVCLMEWKEAKFIYDRRKQAAENTTAARSPNGHRLRKVKNVHRSADTRTGTVTLTRTETGIREEPLLPAVIRLPATGGQMYGVASDQVEKWEGLYPAVDVMQELRCMVGWLDADPKRRKTMNGMARFVTRWLAKEQNHGPKQNGSRNGNGFIGKGERGRIIADEAIRELEEEIVEALTATALLRGGTPDKDMLKAYSSRLAKERLEDVLMALEKLGEIPRGEYESVIPDIGGILAIVSAMAVARRNRDAPPVYYQQQVCPVCKSVAAMQRPVGEQFRTWCAPCGSYRKIIPEDLELTQSEWQLLCVDLDTIYREWVRRGKNPKECVDPQIDRGNYARTA